jgi:hypothetical protein
MNDRQTACLRCVFYKIFIRLVCASCDSIALRCVFYVSVGIYIHIACMYGKCIMGYEYFIYRIDMCLDVSI